MEKNSYLALLPFYDQYGQNCTEVLLSTGEVETFKLSIKQFKKRLLYDLYIDPLALKRWSKQFLYEPKHAPLIIDAETIFLPFQTRTDVPHGDGCFGYVLAAAIEAVEGTTLKLKNGSQIPTLSSPSYIHKRQIDGRVLSLAYQVTR